MNVKELIAALSQTDPNMKAGDAVYAIRQKAYEDRLMVLTTKEGVRAAYPEILSRVTNAVDSKGNTNATIGLRREAFNALRSEVHEAILHFNPMPSAAELEVTFASLKSEKARRSAIHEVQKAHGIETWEKTDALVAAAGVTAEGGA